MSETLFFHIGRKKFMENVNIKPSFSQYLVTIFFFQSVFWSHFNHHQKSQPGQKQCICGVTCLAFVFCCALYEPLKSKEIGVLRPIFSDFVVSCDYGS